MVGAGFVFVLFDVRVFVDFDGGGRHGVFHVLAAAVDGWFFGGDVVEGGRLAPTFDAVDFAVLQADDDFVALEVHLALGDDDVAGVGGDAGVGIVFAAVGLEVDRQLLRVVGGFVLGDGDGRGGKERECEVFRAQVHRYS